MEVAECLPLKPFNLTLIDIEHLQETVSRKINEGCTRIVSSHAHSYETPNRIV